MGGPPRADACYTHQSLQNDRESTIDHSLVSPTCPLPRTATALSQLRPPSAHPVTLVLPPSVPVASPAGPLPLAALATAPPPPPLRPGATDSSIVGSGAFATSRKAEELCEALSVAMAATSEGTSSRGGAGEEAAGPSVIVGDSARQTPHGDSAKAPSVLDGGEGG